MVGGVAVKTNGWRVPGYLVLSTQYACTWRCCCVGWRYSAVGNAADDGAAIGDAWSDPRNPIVKLFGGERLDLWSLKPVKRPDVPDDSLYVR